MRELICISCPMGCHLKVEGDSLENIVVTGNGCIRGVIYAKNEITAPKRMVCGTVKIEGATQPVVSVKTKEPIPKEKIFDCLEQFNQTTIFAPVNVGDVAISNVCGTGVDVVVTKGLAKK